MLAYISFFLLIGSLNKRRQVERWNLDNVGSFEETNFFLYKKQYYFD